LVFSTATPLTTALVHIVDDELALREALSFLLSTRGLNTQLYESGAQFLEVYRRIPERPECMLLDVRMPSMSGLQLFGQLPTRGIHMPVIFLTGHADVPMAVQALKAGAFDFTEKPFSDNELVDRVDSALAASRAALDRRLQATLVRDRIATLTPREMEVMEAVAAGRLNKVIADDLGVSMRTIEVHRSRVFEKMGVRGAVELATLLSEWKESS
jgi:two-component system, LuxR family, response regulator DctR